MHTNEHKSENGLELSAQNPGPGNRLFLHILTGRGTEIRCHVVQMGRRTYIVEQLDKTDGEEQKKVIMIE